MPQPKYLDLLAKGKLEKRAVLFKKILVDCVLCPHQCKVNRLEGERGIVKL